MKIVSWLRTGSLFLTILLFLTHCTPKSASMTSQTVRQVVTVKGLADTDPRQLPESASVVSLETYDTHELSNEFVASVRIEQDPIQPNSQGDFVFQSEIPKFNAVQAYYWVTKGGHFYSSAFKSIGVNEWRLRDSTGQDVLQAHLPRTAISYSNLLPSFLGLAGIGDFAGRRVSESVMQGSLTFGIMSHGTSDITQIMHEYGHFIKTVAEVAGVNRTGQSPRLDSFQEDMDQGVNDESHFSIVEEGYADFFSLSFLDYSFFGRHIFPTWIQDISESKSFPQDLVSEKASCLLTMEFIRTLAEFRDSSQYADAACDASSEVAVDMRFSSRIISSTFWELRSVLGRDTTTKLLLLGLTIDPKQDSLVAPLLAIQKADDILNQGQNKQLVGEVFHRHGIFPGMVLGSERPL